MNILDLRTSKRRPASVYVNITKNTSYNTLLTSLKTLGLPYNQFKTPKVTLLTKQQSLPDSIDVKQASSTIINFSLVTLGPNDTRIFLVARLFSSIMHTIYHYCDADADPMSTFPCIVVARDVSPNLENKVKALNDSSVVQDRPLLYIDNIVYENTDLII